MKLVPNCSISKSKWLRWDCIHRRDSTKPSCLKCSKKFYLVLCKHTDFGGNCAFLKGYNQTFYFSTSYICHGNMWKTIKSWLLIDSY